MEPKTHAALQVLDIQFLQYSISQERVVTSAGHVQISSKFVGSSLRDGVRSITGEVCGLFLSLDLQAANNGGKASLTSELLWKSS